MKKHKAQLVLASAALLLALGSAKAKAAEPDVYHGTSHSYAGFVETEEIEENGGLTILMNAVVATTDGEDVETEVVGTYDNYDDARKTAEREAKERANDELDDQRAENNRDNFFRRLGRNLLRLFTRRDDEAESVMLHPDGRGDERSGGDLPITGPGEGSDPRF